MKTIQRNKPDERGLSEGLGDLVLSAGPLRAGTEAVALTAALIFVVFLSPDRPSGAAVFQVLVAGPLGAILFSVRMRLRVGPWRTNARLEVVVGVVGMALVTAPDMVLLIVDSASGFTLWGVVLTFVWNLGAFAFFRVLAYLWPRWTWLRRSRLRWQMTHTTLVVVAIIASVVTLLIALLSLLSSGLISLPAGVVNILPVVGVSIFLTVVTLAFILPPAALVSYFATRRTAERLEALTHGTSALREGNFDIRVAVDGEDEVSDLQKDFNAMADDLEKTVQDLRSEREAVERLLKTQRELVASVSHELRTPVATMRGYLESALDGKSEEQVLPKDLRHDLEIMGREVIRLQRLIDDLFTLSRAETGNLALEIRPTDVAALLARCAEAASEAAWRTGRVEVIQDAEANAMANLPPALADEGRLEQIIRNLLSNAVRHTPPGGIVALDAAVEPDAVVIEVKDTGEGISPEDLGRVFERFYRSDRTRRLDHSGAGLGLALVKELTEAMDGTVSVESEPGSGSRFVLRLPHAGISGVALA